MPLKVTMGPKRKGKKHVPQSHATSEATVDALTDASSLNPRLEDQFELELCWCIQQLEVGLNSGKLQEKQTQDIKKHLYSLKSNTAPVIKKRQIMRNILGDYREKMAEDERKFSKTVSTVKFASPATINKKSVFIRKATRQSQKETNNDEVQDTLVSTKQAIVNINQTPTLFQFNF